MAACRADIRFETHPLSRNYTLMNEISRWPISEIVLRRSAAPEAIMVVCIRVEAKLIILRSFI